MKRGLDLWLRYPTHYRESRTPLQAVTTRLYLTLDPWRSVCAVVLEGLLYFNAGVRRYTDG